MTTAHEHWMRRAILLADKGRPLASPNPLVGACLVKDGRLVAEGFHACYGAAHAEVAALQKAGRRAKGATLYVTLEPCSTWGKTPPCTDAIIRSGVKRVVIGLIDPNPHHRGRGVRILRQAGIRVESGVLAKACAGQNQTFCHWVSTGRPFVILKMAESLDGKICSSTGHSRWISGPRARAWVHQLRSGVDAVMVGTNTIRRDDPMLTTHDRRARREPWRIVLDANGQLTPARRVFKGRGLTILVCTARSFSRSIRKFSKSKVVILKAGHDSAGRIDLRALLSQLGKLGVSSLLVEGGGELAASFLEAGLVNQIHFIVAPTIIGGRDAKTSVEGRGVRLVNSALRIPNLGVQKLGEDFLFSGLIEGN